MLAKTENEVIDLNKINTSDYKLLFKTEPNLIVLNKEEMKKTEGEFVPIVIGVIRVGSFLNAPNIGDSKNEYFIY